MIYNLKLLLLILNRLPHDSMNYFPTGSDVILEGI
jgi:hypothetical protein